MRKRGQPDDDTGDEQDLLKKFFKDPFGGDRSPHMFRQEQSGTGFIVDRNGYIVTNNHVIDKMDRVRVRLHGDSTDYRARVIGTDSETDVAVIKIDKLAACSRSPSATRMGCRSEIGRSPSDRRSAWKRP